MKLIYEVPGRPQDQLALQPGERKDSENPIVKSGETFDVSDKRGRELLAQLYPTVSEPKPASEENPVKAARKRKPAKAQTAPKPPAASEAAKPAAATAPAAKK